MPSLSELQHAIGRGIVAGTADACASILPYVAADGIAPDARLDVYRNNFLGCLINALRLCYPAVQRLVGADFFAQAAEIFIRGAPPRSANLNDYGAGFAAFLARFAPVALLPYLPDVARLEWAVNSALHAPDAPGLALAGLAEIGDAENLRFAPHPSLALLAVDFPADAIWRAVLEEDDSALRRIDIADGPVGLLIHYATEIHVERLTEAEWRFAQALASGAALGEAMAKATEIDATAALAGHLATGRLIDFTLVPLSEKATSHD